MRHAVRPTRVIASWISALALLSYALAAGPIMLRMAAAHASAPAEHMASMPYLLHASHLSTQHPGGQPSLGDHEHCLFCQGGIGPGLIAASAEWTAPSLGPAPFAMVRGSPLAIRHVDAGYAPRAPPRLT